MPLVSEPTHVSTITAQTHLVHHLPNQAPFFLFVFGVAVLSLFERTSLTDPQRPAGWRRRCLHVRWSSEENRQVAEVAS